MGNRITRKRNRGSNIDAHNIIVTVLNKKSTKKPLPQLEADVVEKVNEIVSSVSGACRVYVAFDGDIENKRKP
jgi:hypothetical protein